MSEVFTDAELEYLHGDRRLGRIATVGPDGTPHVVPTGWTHNSDLDTLDFEGMDLPSTKKFRDVARTGRAAVVIDDVLPPWQPRGVEVRGRAEALTEPSALIRLYPERVVSWGIEDSRMGVRHARTVP
ncbi:PPOX class F420-dependent oxidoreductase [Egibacter rhizosphaerae]|uniref:PPOX class F420-dependent oxidoreductase n=1 Tax=Egibacter rhizosphaerae TaxID=1670831 RepID=UPI00197ADEB2|nr:PPOX class F420-dependent oxidoreductase [Egibacter rhizosphaerae]